MSKLRLIPMVFGVVLLVSTLVGAQRLLHNDAAPPGGGVGSPEPAAQPAGGGSLVAKGTVTSDPAIISYNLPAHLPVGTVVKVEVVNGQSVKPNDVLIRFDDTMFLKDKKKAEETYNASFARYKTALANHSNHPLIIEKAKLAVEGAKQQKARAGEGVDVTGRTIDQALDALRIDGAPLTADEKMRRKKDNPSYIAALAASETADMLIRKTELDLKDAEQSEQLLRSLVHEAAAAATVVKADVDKIDQAIADCVLRAKVPGVVELVTATEGQVVYPQTRPPLLYLIPSGKRIVTAEIVPDFAHMLKDRVGKQVKITDDNRQDHKYDGVIKRIGSAFLPKANAAADVISGKTTNVLIVEIEVTDPAPRDLPPLRVGQPVRVTIP